MLQEDENIGIYKLKISKDKAEIVKVESKLDINVAFNGQNILEFNEGWVIFPQFVESYMEKTAIGGLIKVKADNSQIQEAVLLPLENIA